MNKLELYRMASDLLNEMGHRSEFREEYSGRGMFGCTTPAIVTSANLTDVNYAIMTSYNLNSYDSEVSESYEDVKNKVRFMIEDSKQYLFTKSDNMGKDSIYY